MNKDHFQSLRDALQKMAARYKLEEKLEQERVQQAWHAVVGPFCSERTVQVKYKDGVLTVEIVSAALKQELSYARTDIIKKINEHLNAEIVKDIRII